MSGKCNQLSRQLSCNTFFRDRLPRPPTKHAGCAGLQQLVPTDDVCEAVGYLRHRLLIQRQVWSPSVLSSIVVNIKHDSEAAKCVMPGSYPAP
jgi:hypothetical protein